MKATAIANSNIAFIKYWGKSNIKLNLPLNPSISMTLSELNTKTTVEFSENYKEDIFILNNEKQSGKKLERVVNFLNVIRTRARTSLKAKIVSMNNFPTASGIASSASGFCALAASSAKALGLNLTLKEISALARLGSGSAARSVYSGIVYWDNEYAVQLYDKDYWPELRDIIAIFSEKEKKISSREAMLFTQEKSELFKKRLINVKERVKLLKQALKEKDFQKLAKLIMIDSDEMHACINEVNINYLNEKSEKIKNLVNNMNKEKVIAAYSFDAGPNAHIITLSNYVDEIIEKLKHITPHLIINSPGEGVRFSEEHLF